MKRIDKEAEESVRAFIQERFPGIEDLDGSSEYRKDLMCLFKSGFSRALELAIGKVDEFDGSNILLSLVKDSIRNIASESLDEDIANEESEAGPSGQVDE